MIITGRIPALRQTATASRTSGRGGSMIPTRPSSVSDDSGSSSGPSIVRQANPSTRMPPPARASLAASARCFQDSSNSTTPVPSNTAVACSIKPSGAPLTNEIVRSCARAARSALTPASGAWIVLIRLRVESNGRSSTRGTALRSAATSSPASWAACRSAVSVGSPSRAIVPSASRWNSPSLQSNPATSANRSAGGPASTPPAGSDSNRS